MTEPVRRIFFFLQFPEYQHRCLWSPDVLVHVSVRPRRIQVARSNICHSVPALYEKYVNTSNPAFDEWDLSQNMAADTANGGLQQLENHYKTFIVSCFLQSSSRSFAHDFLVDRARLRPDCRSRSQLRSYSHSFLGH